MNINRSVVFQKVHFIRNERYHFLNTANPFSDRLYAGLRKAPTSGNLPEVEQAARRTVSGFGLCSIGSRNEAGDGPRSGDFINHPMDSKAADAVDAASGGTARHGFAIRSKSGTGTRSNLDVSALLNGPSDRADRI